MRHGWAVGLVLVVVAGGPATAQPPGGKIVHEQWDVAYLHAYLQGSRAGFVHNYTEEFEEKGKKVYRSTMALRLKVLRFASVVDLGMDTGTTEPADGKVVGTFMRQYVGKKKSLEIVGTVMGDKIQLVRDGSTPLMPAPWNDDAIGQYRQDTFLKDRKVKAGDS